MKFEDADIRTAIANYCAAIGLDPLLVQGAGGNVSWKDDETLWVKASGTWLADAASNDIFVPVNLRHLHEAIDQNDFGVTPILCGDSKLRPSIETLLHALMPHRIVVHLHAVEILARLVRDEFEASIQSRLGAAIKWVSVDYHKPGAALAEAVSLALRQRPDANVVFLKNHGVVMGGADVGEVDRILRTLTGILGTVPAVSCNILTPESPLIVNDDVRYLPIGDADVHQLATNADLFNRIASNWALYPDHVVFLGAQAHRYSTPEELRIELTDSEPPELVFIEGVGVFTQPDFNAAKQAQLRCYYDVLIRQPESQAAKSLTNTQIADLLNWDAEKYRMKLAK